MQTLENVDLVILSPTHGDVFTPQQAETHVTVTLSGEIVSTTHGSIPLIQKWYSSLVGEIDTSDTLAGDLSVGSHVITLTAQDKDDAGIPKDELAALYASMEHIGSTGGPPIFPPVDSASPCVIHVLIANMLKPDKEPNSRPTPLSRSAPELQAEAPLQWANFPDYQELNQKYHEVNKLRYRWFFKPVSSSAEIELDLQNGNALELLEPDDDNPARLSFLGVLPDSLSVGEQYILRLRVEHNDDPGTGHQVSRVVTIKP